MSQPSPNIVLSVQFKTASQGSKEEPQKKKLQVLL